MPLGGCDDRMVESVAFLCLSCAQLSLADFRRLCILKGIYPRDPKKKRYGKDQVYYHKKDLLHLAADGALLSTLRDIKATDKKIRKSIGRKEHKDAKRRLRARPKLPLQHLIKQKFPSLVDAIEDLDDCLCTTFLIAGRLRMASSVPAVLQAAPAAADAAV